MSKAQGNFEDFKKKEEGVKVFPSLEDKVDIKKEYKKKAYEKQKQHNKEN